MPQSMVLSQQPLTQRNLRASSDKKKIKKNSRLSGYFLMNGTNRTLFYIKQIV
jgi:hypothetical protein